MPSRPSPLRRPLAAATGITLLASSLALAAGAFAPASANPAGTALVINEVYGAGGNNGALYNADYVEIKNPTGAPMSLSGLYLSYKSAGGGSGGPPFALAGTVPAHGTWLVQMSATGASGAALPTPDQVASPAFNMAAAGGQTLLQTSSTVLTVSGNVAGAAGIVDMVGASGSTTFETAAAGSASTTVSLNRNATGADSDSNSADFTTAAPSPTPSGGGGTDPEPEPEPGQTLTIAQVQGADAATSPYNNTTVKVEGIVTAMYATGGYNGMYVQTAGTGGTTDATPGASDAIFVYGGTGFTNPQGLEIGDSVKVTGPVSEFNGTTQITPASGGVVELSTALAPVTPLAIAYPTTEAGREAQEGMLLAPTDTFTVSNTYSTNQYAEIGLATGTEPLLTPTEVADAQDASAIAAVVADNAARGVVLDDGASTNFLTSANQGVALPWLSKENPVRVGARATLGTGGVVLEYRNSTWKLQPRQQVTGAGASTATFQNTRLAEAAPAEVGGDISLSSFNVLNYFTQTAEIAGCTSTYKDRAGNPITANSCGDAGPRGAANDVNLQRQQTKIVAAINKLDASVVSLEEIENSVKFNKNRDQALSTLVAALNQAAGSTKWALVPSPDASGLPAVGTQDVIRNAFIYQPAEVAMVGTSKVLVGNAAFNNARQPLAQGFKEVGAPSSDAFTVIVNHFKSKGSGADDGTGQGLSNADRVAQAGALSDFATEFSDALGGNGAIFLTGDFNSYSMEDPMQVLHGDDYENLAPEGEYTYSFSGQSGSLDHILANPAGVEMVTGSDIWNINSGEAIAFEYSRHNYNVTDFYEPNQFRASDHDPIKVGLSTASAPTGPVDVQLLNINDFHGRIDANTTRFATTVEQLRAQNENTLFLSAGDNIGASLFASALDKDQPTIDVLNALGLEASAVGNHEFDQGFADLTGRVDSAASWDYLGANVYGKGTTTPALREYQTYEVGGVTVGVIGVVTSETPSLVSPAGVADVTFGDPVAAVNRVATQLSDGDEANGEADVIVAEYHEGAGAGTPEGATLEQELAQPSAFTDIVTKTSAQVDAIFTGHTHKQYAWDAQVPGAPAGTTRPVLQTGSYGEFIGQIVLTFDPATGTVTSHTQKNVARATNENLSLGAVSTVKTIVDAALAKAAVVGNQEIGRITGDITTAHTGGTQGAGGYTGGSRDDRASESTLGGLVANALRDGAAKFAKPDLGITNSGGLRAELTFKGDTSSNAANVDGVVTYAEANAVLPFNNTVAIVEMSGSTLKSVLEQQWQSVLSGPAPSRPYLQLALSDNVEVTADKSKPAGERITSVRINGVLLDPAKTYTVSTLSFLAAGGDNFRAFTQGKSVDTGVLDGQLWRDYLATNKPLSPDFARQQVFATGLPSELTAGQAASFQLGTATGGTVAPITGTTLDLTSQGSPATTKVTATLVNGSTRTTIGEFPVTAGVASINLTVPAGTPTGATVELVAAPSRTRVTLPVKAGTTTPPTTDPTPNPTPNPTPTPTPSPNPEPVPTPEEKAEATIKSFNAQGKVGQKVRFKVKVKVTADGANPRGTVTAQVKGTKKVVEVKVSKKGVAIIKLPAFKNPGTKKVVVRFTGNGDVAAEKTVVKLRIKR
ncbi:ExeM/NucH family extracellular endonuclease [Nocardioides oleivorans]|nr:ExeM/NucH family extracellular endonuclease [Nocardioides oleivorans]